jgi:hypothetical protein
MRLTRIRTEVRSQRYGIAMGAVALLVALGAPAYAFDGVTSAANTVAKALKIAKKADKRSKQALSLAKKNSGKPGPQGLKGDPGAQGAQGAQGAPGSAAQFNGASAGGSLTGTYPNPTLGADSVSSSTIADGTVFSQDLRGGAVNAAALGDRIRTDSSGVLIPGGTGQNSAYNTASQVVTCPAGMKLLGGGGIWDPNPPADEELFIQSAFYAGFGTEQFIVVGGNDSGIDRTFRASAICLKA